jgi:tetratricopeptide (TPR) repeat protein
MTKEITQFGGYGSPSLVSVTAIPDEPLRVIVSFSTMSRGNNAEGTVLYQIRHDPVVDRLYVVSWLVGSMENASEELQGYCARSENNDRPVCSNKDYWGKRTIYLKRGELDKLFRRGQSLDAYQTAVLIAAHESALDAYKRNDYKNKLPFQQLESAGVRAIIDQKPESMSLHRYVNILNDYAFFAYKYGEGRTELAIEILYRVIKLIPDRKAAYLNMYEALQYSASYPSIPRSSEVAGKLYRKADFYIKKYESM